MYMHMYSMYICIYILIIFMTVHTFHLLFMTLDHVYIDVCEGSRHTVNISVLK